MPAMADCSPRILVVDDQPTSVGLLMAYLRDRGVDLLVAQNGADASRIAVDGRPDLILLDVMMPGNDGFTICERLKADRRTASIPVIFLSAAMETADKLRGFAAGGADYITKPFSEQEVLARVFVKLGERRSTALRDQRMFHQAVAILSHHLTDPPSGVELAHRVCTNQQRLTRIFREHVGMRASTVAVGAGSGAPPRHRSSGSTHRRPSWISQRRGLYACIQAPLRRHAQAVPLPTPGRRTG